MENKFQQRHEFDVSQKALFWTVAWSTSFAVNAIAIGSGESLLYSNLIILGVFMYFETSKN